MKQGMSVLVVLCFSPFVAELSLGARYQVGPDKPYTTLQAVADVLAPGDIVEVDGDHSYPGGVSFTNPGLPDQKIEIRGITINGRRPVISGGTDSVAFTTWPLSGPGGDHYVFENFEVTGGTRRCIYHQADDLTVRNTVVHDCPAHGILGADGGSGSLLLEYVEVYQCGSGDRQHQIYMATDEVNRPGSVFRMQFCYIHDGSGGNNVKSRAERNEIYYNWIEGAYYHELELIGPDPGGAPDGWSEELKREDSDVVGNVLRKTNDRSFITRVGGDGTGQSQGRYRFVNNTIIANGNAIFRIFDGIESLEIHNNVFYRADAAPDLVRQVEAEWISGSPVIAGSNNWVKTGTANIPGQWTATVTGSAPGFVDFAALDFKPASNSPLRDRTDQVPAGPAGYPFPVPHYPPSNHPPERVLPADGEAMWRASDSLLDVGAFEYAAAVLAGDLNGDGSVGLVDAMIALQIVSGIATDDLRPDYPDSGADVNGDGRVGLAEAIFACRESSLMD
ncbi:MAG: dockerin type I repeat-containing protein [Desulfobulbaceae bacterium]|nr:dockerin type I repeat-containing protein [Desulfobulbaceae bacterium]